MFLNKLSENLRNTFVNKVRGRGRVDQSTINEMIANVSRALLDADVALSVVKDFTAHIKEKAADHQFSKKIRPGDALIKLVQDELTHLLGDMQSQLNLRAQPPVVILMAGLQGSGKTTTTAKLARYIKQQHQKSVLVTSTDVYRPAAIEQLAILAEQIDILHFPSSVDEDPVDIAQRALQHAKTKFVDVLIIDTAGRLHIDDEMMKEIRLISDKCHPTEILLVVDSMAGQDAANVAKTFNEVLELTGVILTKADGDARGGAALSMRMITGKPIKFVGMGEKIDAIEVFHPDRIASRILGMGDIVSLVEKAQRELDTDQAKKLAKKVTKGKTFDFNDFLIQLQQMKKMGGIQAMLGKLPGVSQLPPMANQFDDESLKQNEAIIQSMTPKERQFPALLDASRKKRIADGSGTSHQDVSRLIKQFTQMQKMLKRFKGDKMMKRLRQMKNLPSDFSNLFPKD